MDTSDLIIIAIATMTAIVFKVYLYRRIKHWMNQDLIKGLADGDADKQQYLESELQRLYREKTPRNQIHSALTKIAENYSA